MPDISNEIAAIQAATTGSQIRSAIIEALNVINDYVPSYYSGSYIVSPGSSSIILPTSNKGMYDDVTIEAFPVYSGIYVINPGPVSQTFSVSNMLMASDILVNSVPAYSGSYIISPSTVSQSFPTSSMFMSSDVLVEAVPLYSGNHTIISAVQYVGGFSFYTSEKYVSKNIEVVYFHRPCFNITSTKFDTFDLTSTWDEYLSNAYRQTFSLNSYSYSSEIDLTVVPTESQLSYLRAAGVETFMVEKNNNAGVPGDYMFTIIGSSISTPMLSSSITFQCLFSYASALSSMFI